MKKEQITFFAGAALSRLYDISTYVHTYLKNNPLLEKEVIFWVLVIILWNITRLIKRP